VSLDRERMMAKISHIREQTTSIKGLLDSEKKEEILEDPWLIKGLKYSLQTAIEAMIDLAYHIAAKKFGHAPGDAREALRIILEAGLIARENWPVYSAMIGFRNRIVHGYQEVSSERVYEMARNELADFEKFICEIKPLLPADRSEDKPC